MVDLIHGPASSRYALLTAVAIAVLSCSSCGDTSGGSFKQAVSPDGRYWIRHEYKNAFSPTTSYSAFYIGKTSGELLLVLKVDRLVMDADEVIEWNDTPSSVALLASFGRQGYYRLHALLEQPAMRLERHDEELAKWSATRGIVVGDGSQDSNRVSAAMARVSKANPPPAVGLHDTKQKTGPGRSKDGALHTP